MSRQIEIGRALRKQGFKVTQSSVSRDLQALGIVRREGVSPPARSEGGREIDREDRGVHPPGRTPPGPTCWSSTPARGRPRRWRWPFKNAAWPEVRGVLAEDDTLFVATDNVYDSRLLMQRLKRIVKVS